MSYTEDTRKKMERIGASPESYVASLCRIVDGLTAPNDPRDVMAFATVFLMETLEFMIAASTPDEESYHRAVDHVIETLKKAEYRKPRFS